jgi:hypothetical protein
MAPVMGPWRNENRGSAAGSAPVVAAEVENVRIGHRGFDIAVTEQFLNCANVST